MNSHPRDPQLLALFSKALWEVDHKRIEDLDLDQPIAHLGIDSVSMLEVVGYLEEELELHIPEEELQRVRTLGELADTIAALRS